MTALPSLRCAPAAQAREDQLFGTAAPVERWLLIEQPGPWGRNAVTGSRLGAEVSTELTRRCAAARIRVMVIRRPGRRPVFATDRCWGYADSRPGHEQLRWGRFAHDDDLLDIPLDGSGGQASPEPAYLVCAHARHDACCAIRGRPVAAALAALHPDRTWECSHTGGDRFAANVVILPHGFYYGQVSPNRVAALVNAHDAGRVEPDALRGRSCFPALVQAAQHYARVALNATAIIDLAPLSIQGIDATTSRVALSHRGGTMWVTVRVEQSTATRLTCAADRPESARRFVLESMSGPST